MAHHSDLGGLGRIAGELRGERGDCALGGNLLYTKVPTVCGRWDRLTRNDVHACFKAVIDDAQDGNPGVFSLDTAGVFFTELTLGLDKKLPLGQAITADLAHRYERRFKEGLASHLTALKAQRGIFNDKEVHRWIDKFDPNLWPFR